jgi:hypothetical protein
VRLRALGRMVAREVGRVRRGDVVGIHGRKVGCRGRGTVLESSRGRRRSNPALRSLSTLLQRRGRVCEGVGPVVVLLLLEVRLVLQRDSLSILSVGLGVGEGLLLLMELVLLLVVLLLREMVLLLLVGGSWDGQRRLAGGRTRSCGEGLGV